MLIVHNHRPRLVDIPGPYLKSPDGSGGVTNEFTLKLKPGANEIVNPAQWEAVKEFHVVKQMIKDHDLEVKQHQAAEFEKLATDEAMSLTGETLDRDLLRKWHAGETRGKVKLAIEKQIEKVTVKKPKTVEE